MLASFLCLPSLSSSVFMMVDENLRNTYIQYFQIMECHAYNCLKQENQERNKPLINGAREADYDSMRNNGHGKLPEDVANFHNVHLAVDKYSYKNDNAHGTIPEDAVKFHNAHSSEFDRDLNKKSNARKVLPTNEIDYHNAHSTVDRDLNEEYENILASAHQDPSHDVCCGAHEDLDNVRNGAHSEHMRHS